jgi:Ion channel
MTIMNRRTRQPSPHQPPRIWGHLARQGRLFSLLLAMVLLLLVYPLLEGDGMRIPLLDLLVIATLLFGVDAVSTTRRHVLIALSLSALPLFLVLEGSIFGHAVSTAIPLMRYAGMALLLLFYLFTIAMLLASIVRRQQVTPEAIYGAMCVYILLGVAWGSLYTFLEAHRPGSFYIDEAHNLNHVVEIFDLMFYSFVTLTTLGYGDITPITSPARAHCPGSHHWGVLPGDLHRASGRELPAEALGGELRRGYGTPAHRAHFV